MSQPKSKPTGSAEPAHEMEEVEVKATSRTELDGWRTDLWDRTTAYFGVAAEYFLDNEYLRNQAIEHTAKARELLTGLFDKDKKDQDYAAVLSRVEPELTLVQAAIAEERQIKRGELLLAFVVIGMIAISALGLLFLAMFARYPSASLPDIPVLGIPVPVIAWAAVGSLCAILRRFYTRKRGRIEAQARWLIARPVIGVMAGALSYLAVVSGLLILGRAAGMDVNPEGARPELLWAIAFVAAYSDRFFENIIHSTLLQVGGSGEKEEEGSSTEKAG